mmetsp:Transcript_86218/g.261744  ORF Transcript_86218/g.261744 Transcript_86218/m.261744 type:complete len:229 (+) Transcript_86218:3-689(+)
MRHTSGSRGSGHVCSSPPIWSARSRMCRCRPCKSRHRRSTECRRTSSSSSATSRTWNTASSSTCSRCGGTMGHGVQRRRASTMQGLGSSASLIRSGSKCHASGRLGARHSGSREVYINFASSVVANVAPRFPLPRGRWPPSGPNQCHCHHLSGSIRGGDHGAGGPVHGHSAARGSALHSGHCHTTARLGVALTTEGREDEAHPGGKWRGRGRQAPVSRQHIVVLPCPV